MSPTRVCLAESRFFNITPNQFPDLIRSSEIYLLPNGDSYLTNLEGELESVCPEVTPSTWFLNSYFLTNLQGNYDTEDFRYLRGHKVRFKDGNQYKGEYLTGEVLEEKLVTTLSSPVLMEVESNLPYKNYVFDTNRPDDCFNYWWDTNTETLYLVEAGEAAIELDPSLGERQTQESLRSTAIDELVLDAYGTVVRLYPDKGIRVQESQGFIEEEDHQIEAFTFDFNLRWQIDLSNPQGEVLLGEIPRQKRIEQFNLCTKNQYFNPSSAVRYDYEKVSNEDCKTILGLNPCYRRFKLVCDISEIAGGI